MSLTEPRELDRHYEPDDATLRGWLLVLHTAYAVRRLAELRLYTAGLTMAQAEVLTTLMLMGGVANPARIARFLFRESQSVVGILARMERAGLVHCIKRFRGGKETRVVVSGKGRELFKAASAVKFDTATELFSVVSSQDMEHLMTTLSRLRQQSILLLEAEQARRPLTVPVSLPE